MSDTTVPLNERWNYHCPRCGVLIYMGSGHTCPPGIYDQPAPQFPVGWPAPDYSAVLERIAAALEVIASRSAPDPMADSAGDCRSGVVDTGVDGQSTDEWEQQHDPKVSR